MEKIISGLAIRAMVLRDVEFVFQIQTDSAEAAQWPKSAYESFCPLRAGEFAWVAERAGRIAGFLIAREVAREMEILNLAVAPVARREGIGSALLGHAVAHAAENGAGKIFLEVRSSNVAALRFYEAHRFSSIGTRPNYYSNPLEDAALLALLPITVH